MAYMRDADGNRLDEIHVEQRLDDIETAEGTYGDIVTHNASEFATAAELAAEETARANGDATNATAITNEATARANGDTANANAITAEATARANADSAEVTARNNAIAAQAAADAAAYAAKSYELSGVELANAEVGYAVATTFPVSPASPVGITGAVINVPTLTGPFDIIYGCDARVTTAGGGLLRLDLRETVNFSASQDWAAFPITADFSVSLLQSGYKIPLRGRKRFSASDSGKTYFLTILLYRDTSSGLVAVAQNQPDMLTFMTAVGR